MSVWNPDAPKKVVEFYLLTVKLKNVIRTGWRQWNVPRERLESVLEHVSSATILALAMWSEYNHKVDLFKVVMMLTIHELEEIYIGDITPYSGVSPEEKERMGHEAVQKMLSPINVGNVYFEFIKEFDERITDDAKFAYMCDKLDADLMARVYDPCGKCTLEKAESILQNNESLRNLEKNGAVSMSDYFYQVDRNKYDEAFKEVLDFMYSERLSQDTLKGLQEAFKEEQEIYEDNFRMKLAEISRIAAKLE